VCNQGRFINTDTKTDHQDVQGHAKRKGSECCLPINVALVGKKGVDCVHFAGLERMDMPEEDVDEKTNADTEAV
jgi:hypothetical protein